MEINGKPIKEIQSIELEGYRQRINEEIRRRWLEETLEKLQCILRDSSSPYEG